MFLLVFLFFFLIYVQSSLQSILCIIYIPKNYHFVSYTLRKPNRHLVPLNLQKQGSVISLWSIDSTLSSAFSGSGRRKTQFLCISLAVGTSQVPRTQFRLGYSNAYQLITPSKFYWFVFAHFHFGPLLILVPATSRLVFDLFQRIWKRFQRTIHWPCLILPEESWERLGSY